MKTRSIVWGLIFFLCGALLFAASTVAAESPITLKTVTFLPKNDHHLDYFWKFVERVQ